MSTAAGLQAIGNAWSGDGAAAGTVGARGKAGVLIRDLERVISILERRGDNPMELNRAKEQRQKLLDSVNRRAMPMPSMGANRRPAVQRAQEAEEQQFLDQQGVGANMRPTMGIGDLTPPQSDYEPIASPVQMNLGDMPGNIPRPQKKPRPSGTALTGTRKDMYEPVPELAPIQENPIQSELGAISGMPQKPRGEDTEDSFDKYSPLITAGLAMMASKNPTALGAIGEGGLAGFGDLRQQQKLKRDQKKEDRELGQKDRALDLELRKIDTSALNDVEKLKVEREKSKILDDYYKGRLKADEAENQIRALSVRVMDAQRRDAVTARSEDNEANRKGREAQAARASLDRREKIAADMYEKGVQMDPIGTRRMLMRGYGDTSAGQAAAYEQLLDDLKTNKKSLDGFIKGLQDPEVRATFEKQYGKATIASVLGE